MIVEPGTAPPLGERACKSRYPLARERRLHLTVLLRDREVLVAHPFQHVERLELVQQPDQSVLGTLGRRLAHDLDRSAMTHRVVGAGYRFERSIRDEPLLKAGLG